MKQILNRLFNHEILSREEASVVMKNIAAGAYNDAQIAAFMSVYLMRSIELEEVIGFRNALLELALPIDLSEFDPLDIVGTGGDGKNTFNISTCSCFVVAGAGYTVAKHGNYGSTSVSGSSNVLEYLGAKFSSDINILKKSLEKSGFAFLHAPLFNPAMKNVAAIRKNLGIRTFFNVLGPLISPVRPRYQCLGVYDLKMMRLYNYIYQNLGVGYAVVHSLDGYDEISLTDNSKIVNNQGEFVFQPENEGFKRIAQQDLWGGDTIDEAAQIFMNVLENKATEAQTNVVIINSALAIQTRMPSKTLNQCIVEARVSLENGNAKRSFDNFLSLCS